MTWLQQEQHREAKDNAGIHSRVAKMVSSIAAAAAPSCNLLICGSPPDSGSDAEDAIHITVPPYVFDSDTKYSFPESLSFTMPCLADCLPTMAVDDCDLELDFDELI
ncbi:hypothetical protein HaLaN_17157 [Haematococcus lacustris]|uniref:Uncharacterized protein n=1 Tax=Haematococcus lacustris TaxID=44745 RepID=A0A699ZNM0_HAELA|nr:hypothetical protein HaLaN_17157 [Haematococcus lacustris]